MLNVNKNMLKRAINANKPGMNIAMDDKCMTDTLVTKYNKIAKSKNLPTKPLIDVDYTDVNDQLLMRAYDGLLHNIERIKDVIQEEEEEEEEQDTMLYGEYEGVLADDVPLTINGWTYMLNDDGNSLTVVLADKNATTLPENLPYNYIKDTSDNDAYPVTSINGMFNGCGALKEIDLNDWDTSMITDMSSAFQTCSSLETLNIDKWNTSNVTTLVSTFAGCAELSMLNIGKWDVSSVSSLNRMFAGSGITTLNLDNWNTVGLTLTQDTFSDCSNLTKLSLRNWNLLNLNDIDNLFNGCSSLETLDLSGWYNVYLPLNAANTVFYGCSALKTLDLSYWRAVFGSFPFTGCDALTTITINKFAFPSVQNFLFAPDNIPAGWKAPDGTIITGTTTWNSAWGSIATFTKSTQ